MIAFYESVSNMIADSLLENGTTVKTLGYYAVNDGGSAYYYIRLKTEQDSIDNGYLHQLVNGLVAEMIIDGNITPEQFGAKGDGTTDDTSVLQKIINHAVEAGVNVIGNGIYNINSTINISMPETEEPVKIVLNNVTYSGTNFAFSVKRAQYLVMEINALTAEKGSGFLFKPESGNERCQYSQFSCRKLEFKYYGVYINPHNGRWVNENVFSKIRGFSQSGTCVYANDESGEGYSCVENNRFEWVCNERYGTKTFYFKNVQSSMIVFPRILEAKHLITAEGKNQLLILMGGQLNLDWVNLSENTFGSIITGYTVYAKNYSRYGSFVIDKGAVLPLVANTSYLTVGNDALSSGVLDWSTKAPSDIPAIIYVYASECTEIKFPRTLLYNEAHLPVLCFGENVPDGCKVSIGSYSFSVPAATFVRYRSYRFTFIPTYNRFAKEELSII